jgi:8-oxo-dGTP pyrophosphatase MutT (NUDIX family)
MDVYKGAGCLFIQNKYVLAGYNPKYKIWSGIGGKIEEGETIRQAAFRETIEELFGFVPSQEIINECDQAFNFIRMITINNYGIIPLSFDLFVHIIYILKAHKCESPYYYTLPNSFIELISERRPVETAEITELKVINYTIPNQVIAEELVKDCINYVNYLDKNKYRPNK